MDRKIAWTCLNPECAATFYAPDVSYLKPPYWQWCPHCRASSRRKSEIDRAEAAAALAAKDAEIERLRVDYEASVDELFRSLGIATAALTAIHTALGCGPHLDDALGAIAALRARLAETKVVVEAARKVTEPINGFNPHEIGRRLDMLRPVALYALTVALDATKEKNDGL